MAVKVRAYLSPTLVLLALDWPDGATRADFLGFAIKRKPGFRSTDGKTREPESWLPNRLTFAGAVPEGRPDAPSNIAPIQKFQWWDARIDEADRNGRFTYTVYPVVGPKAGRDGVVPAIDAEHPPVLLKSAATVRRVTLPDHIEGRVGTWFNRAVLSSQAFSRKLQAMRLDPKTTPSPAKALALRTWLANDLEQVFAEILRGASRASGAIYHLTDDLWAIPRLGAFAKAHPRQLALVYDAHGTAKSGGQPAGPSPNQDVVDALGDVIAFAPRDRTAIMHDKFVVSDGPDAKGRPRRVLMGSANFTTGGLTTQANLLHVFDSPALAKLYDDRASALATNPAKAATVKLAPGWSKPMTIGTAKVRVTYSPEPGGQREQIDSVVAAIARAKNSVLFCIFTPTDRALRQACFAAGDRGLTMFGIVNAISPKSAEAAETAQADGKVLDASALANLELYHRSKSSRDVIDGAFFSAATAPPGFLPEVTLFPGESSQSFGSVVIHHKFVVIDAEGGDPVVYTGSANMSENSQHNNDENLVEIRDKRIAAIYLAEFMRLYEHYRARALAIANADKPRDAAPLALQTTRRWADKYYVANSPEAKARIAMAALRPSR